MLFCSEMAAPSLNREDTLECAICLQSCMHPVQLPCSHVFCFLCAKGIAMQSRKCALCRSDIPPDFIYKPSKFTKGNKNQSMPSSSARYVWYYEGHNGWWQYDDRTCVEIEAAFSNKHTSVDVLVAGSVYVIDFENQIQYQRNRNSRKRKIKRDLETANKKGIAGLHINAREANAVPQPSSSSDTGASSSVAQPIVNSYPCNDIPLNEETSEANGQNFTRQIPLGADQLPADTSSANSIFNASPPTPDLIRAVSDTTGTSMANQSTPVLFRYNTYSRSGATQDTPME